MIKAIRRLTPLTVLNLLVLFLVIEYVILWKFSFIQVHDFSEDVFPRYIALWRNFAAHGFQAWSSDIGGGTDRLSNLVKYDNLLSLLVGALPAWLGYQIYVVASTYGGAASFYVVSTRYLGRPAMLSAFLAASIPVVIGVVNSTGLSAGIQFYPFAIWAVHWVDSRFDNFSQRLLLLSGALYITSITAHFVLSFVYLAPFLAIWFLVVGRVRIATLAAAGGAFVLVILVHFGDLQTLTGLALASHRTEFVGAQTTEGSTFFNYQVVLAVVCAAFILWKRVWDRRLLIVFGVFLLITAGDVFLGRAWTAALGNTPLGTLKISRLGFFSTSLLAAAISSLASRLDQRRVRVLTVLVALNFVGLALMLKAKNAQMWIREGTYVANFETPALRDLRAKDPSLYRVAVLEGVMHPNMLSAYGFETADGYSPMYPLRYKHYWGRVIAPVAARDAEKREYFRTWGSRFYLFTGNPSSGGRYESIALSDFVNLDWLSLANVKYIVSHQPVSDDRLELVSAGVNGMKLGTREKLKLRFRENFSGRQSLFIYRNKDALPRIFTVSAVKYFSGEGELLAYADSAKPAELRTTALEIQASGGSAAATGFTAGAVAVTAYSPSVIEFRVKAGAPALAVISSTLGTGWKCVTDARELEIVDADEGFSAVSVPAGSGAVSCRYLPKWTAF